MEWNPTRVVFPTEIELEQILGAALVFNADPRRSLQEGGALCFVSVEKQNLQLDFML